MYFLVINIVYDVKINYRRDIDFGLSRLSKGQGYGNLLYSQKHQRIKHKSNPNGLFRKIVSNMNIIIVHIT